MICNTNQRKKRVKGKFFLQCIRGCATLCCMKKFDPAIIQGQIDGLLRERDQIDQAIVALQSALRNIEGIEQGELRLPDPSLPETTLHDAVKRACLGMVDGITRQ